MTTPPDHASPAPNDRSLWQVALVAVAFGVISHVGGIVAAQVTSGPQLGNIAPYFCAAYVIACAGAMISGYLGAPHTWRWCFIIAWAHAFCIWLWVLVDWLGDRPFGSPPSIPGRGDMAGFLTILNTLPGYMLVGSFLSLPGVFFTWGGVRLRRLSG